MQNSDRDDPSFSPGPGREQDELLALIERSRLAVRRADALVSALQARYGVGQVRQRPFSVKGTD